MRLKIGLYNMDNQGLEWFGGTTLYMVKNGTTVGQFTFKLDDFTFENVDDIMHGVMNELGYRDLRYVTY